MLSTIFFVSCLGDLDTEPIDDSMLVAEQVYRVKANYKKVLAKCYASLSLSGQQGPSGASDLVGGDEGYSSYPRIYFYLNVVTTEEAFSKSTSQGMRDMVTMNWSPSTSIINMAYGKIYSVIGFCNEFLRQTTPDKLSDRGQDSDANFVAEIEKYRNEARFLRAFGYWVICDAFGHGPFVTENDPVGKFLPPQKSRIEIFNYVESELKYLETKLMEPKTNEYARVDRTAAWFLLSRLYLNAEVYTGTARWEDCLKYAEKTLSSNYRLAPKYIHNFLADNHTSPEIIWPLACDGIRSKAYGNSTFFVMCQTNSTMQGDINLGVAGGWGNIWLRPEFSDRFLASDTLCIEDVKAGEEGKKQIDKRSLIYAKGNKEIPDIPTSQFGKTGYAFAKWRNVTQAGNNGSDPTYVDTDFPLFRLADSYLMASEAAIRLGGAENRTKALKYLNEIRDRAFESGEYGSAVRIPLTDETMTLNYILDERSRELSWELTRRIDLIRFGQFTDGDYLWAWKGNVVKGKKMDKKYNLFPLPEADITANPNLKQNPAYIK